MTSENTDNRDFSERLIGILNDGVLSLMISRGHKTGLFDTLSKFSSPETSEHIAKAAKLDERYVKKWLACMVVGKLMEYDSSSQKYYLPFEHSEYLARSARLENLALFFQYIFLLEILKTNCRLFHKWRRNTHFIIPKVSATTR